MKHLTAAASALILAAATAGVASADGHGDHDGMKMKTKMDTAQMQTMNMKAETGMLSEEQSVLFDSMDTDRNRTIDFTEFSTYLEQNHGYDASESAKEYVRLSDSDGVITDMTFAGMDVTKLPHKHLDNGTTHNGYGTQTAATTSMMANTAVMGATATGYDYGSFASYDMDGDGSVSFDEYRQYRSNAGITATRAAQEFIRFSNGQAMFSESDFENARAMNVLDNPYYRSN